MSRQSLVDQGLSSSTLHDHIRWNTPHSIGRVISPKQRPLTDNTQQSHETDIDDPGGIRTHISSTWATTDPRLRPCVYWDKWYTYTYLFLGHEIWDTLKAKVLYSSETVVHFCEFQRHQLPETSTFYFRMFDVVALNFRLFSRNNEPHMRMYRAHCLRLITVLL